MRVLGISGDPTGKSKVDTLVKTVLENSKYTDTEFISLRELNIGPCKGCFSCIKTNHCTVQDDWNSVESKVKEAEILILGVPTYYGAAFGINALTHSFLERWFSLRHKGIKLNLKKVILIIVSGGEHENTAITNLKTFFEIYHGVTDIEVIVSRGSIPCLVCGEGESCPISFAIEMYGEGLKITPDIMPSLEKQNDVIEKSKLILSK
ncbi:flavodoxin family protein [Clostridium magnum]|uniref:NADPH-dependent FMN reductase n=1 Tax=Clostridium magnum DSM 2767 TaxID=1121326 RepID=A0A162SUT2_9CLOT|nr:flavodoxin family protein [Clostridium magnum]KZL91897.1 NADPH-dependent FMN reductase [Clostridium magnum DSM 2767]SHI25300.1 NADPH-dependent FMN reductase [Clostridium magnum DSM 2767]